MKKLFFFLILGLSTVAIYEFTSWNGTLEIKDLKKEAFKCSGKGLAGKTVYATFEIDPDNDVVGVNVNVAPDIATLFIVFATPAVFNDKSMTEKSIPS